MHTAARVPMCSATSKAFCTLSLSKSFQPNNQGTMIKCPDEEIGRNSDRPWTRPSTMAWRMGMGGAPPGSGAGHDARPPRAGGIEVVADHDPVAQRGEEGRGVGEVGHLDVGGADGIGHVGVASG